MLATLRGEQEEDAMTTITAEKKMVDQMADLALTPVQVGAPAQGRHMEAE
jgi:hypothetical protein